MFPPATGVGQPSPNAIDEDDDPLAALFGSRPAPSEPNHAGDDGGASIWYRWTPSVTGTVTIDTAGSTMPSGGTLDTLLQPANKDQLAAILTYHVVPAEVMAADVQAGEVTTVNGAPFTVALDGGTVTITDGQGNQSNVTKTDIDASNGVIHAIDAVLLPTGS